VSTNGGATGRVRDVCPYTFPWVRMEGSGSWRVWPGKGSCRVEREGCFLQGKQWLIRSLGFELLLVLSLLFLHGVVLSHPSGVARPEAARCALRLFQ